MGRSWCLKRGYVLQVDWLFSQMIEEANPLTEQHMSYVQMKLVKQARLQGLLDATCPVKGNRFLPCDLLRSGYRALNTSGFKGIVHLAQVNVFSGLGLQDNHRPFGRGIIRDNPPILPNLIEASVPHDHGSDLVDLVALDGEEMVHRASVPKPGEDFGDVISSGGDKSIQRCRKAKPNCSHRVLLSLELFYSTVVVIPYFARPSLATRRLAFLYVHSNAVRVLREHSRQTAHGRSAKPSRGFRSFTSCNQLLFF